MFKGRTEIANSLYAKRIEKRSPKTISAYEQALCQFAKWYRANGYEGITPDLTRKYVHYLTFEKPRWDDHRTSPNGVVGLSPRTVNNVIRNMKLFFTHLVRERIISHSPMESIKYQTEEDNDTFEIFTEADVLRLVDAPNTRTYIGLRDRAMMLVLVD